MSVAFYKADLTGLWILLGIIVVLLVAVVFALIWRFGLKGK